MTDYRIEIISNQSVEDDITELIEEAIPEIQYTVMPVVHGKGGHSKKLGTTTWPEQNFLMFSYVSEEEAKKIKQLVELVKLKFPSEGVSFFACKQADL